MPHSQPQRRIEREPIWAPVDRFTAAELPQRERFWLLDDGSLTNRLVATAQGQFYVQRLYQGWQVPMPSERRLLNLPHRELAMVREVALADARGALVFARSVFPLACLTGKLSHLRRLQNKSLGSILFRNPGMHRSPFELTHMAGDSDYLPSALQQQVPAWGRRSRFVIDGKSLMVSEVFLQTFTPWTGLTPVHRSQRGRVSAAITPTKQ